MGDQLYIGAEFSSELLNKLSDLKISLGFFVYADEEQQKRLVVQLDRMSEKIRGVLHKFDPSGIIDKSAPLPELHFDPYQNVFDLLPHLIKAGASKDILLQDVKRKLPYFDRTNTAALKDFNDYDAMAEELSKLEWE